MNWKLKIILFFLPIIFIAGGLFWFLQKEGKNIEIKREKSLEEDDSISSSQASSTLQQDLTQVSSLQTDKTDKTNEVDKKNDADIVNKTNNLSIIKNLVSFGFEKKDSRTIDTIIIHSSYDALGSDPYSVSGLINEYKQYGVAPHYLIDRQGVIYLLVEEKNVAYHAGVSSVPDGRTNVNLIK